jgi:manganese-dependent inorganic pyrophosphatase
MMSGIISDTLHLNSPTSTDKDADILRWLSGVAGVEAGELAGLIFASGSVILSSTPEEVIRNDMKVYEQGEISYSVSQVEELGFNNFWQHRAALEEALETVRQRENYYVAALFVTDINSQNSLLLVQGEQELIEQINYPLVEAQDVFELQGIVSRKKQLIPYFTTLLSSIGIQAKQAG